MYHELYCARSGEHICDYLTLDISQAEIASGVAICQALMVEA
jgi:hypothetical protein